MKLDKVKKSFNDYDLELSWGQLEIVRAALERDHSEPIADEMLAELEWYMDRVPGPGEEEEEVKAREEGGAPVPGESEGEMPVEMPPAEAPGAGPEPPPQEMPGEEAVEAGLEDRSPPAPEGEEGAVGPDEADQHLEAPPAE
jgi:hypothetical protein